MPPRSHHSARHCAARPQLHPSALLTRRQMPAMPQVYLSRLLLERKLRAFMSRPRLVYQAHTACYPPKYPPGTSLAACPPASPLSAGWVCGMWHTSTNCRTVRFATRGCLRSERSIAPAPCRRPRTRMETSTIPTSSPELRLVAPRDMPQGREDGYQRIERSRRIPERLAQRSGFGWPRSRASRERRHVVHRAT